MIFYIVAVTIQSFHLSINDALALTYRSRELFVAHITLVKAVPFYGYYVGNRFFLKIYLLNPLYVSRLADLLLQGAIMKRPFQPYESHLQFIPQWMCDYNLYGCAYMKCGKAKFRRHEYLLNTSDRRWHALPKQSHCDLEVDVCVQDILNRLDVKVRPLHQDFSSEFLNLPLGERLVPSMASLWKDETRRRKQRLNIVDDKSSPFGPEELVSMSAASRDSSRFDGWVHSEEYRQKVLALAGDDSFSDDHYVHHHHHHHHHHHESPFDARVKTVSESVCDFFQEANNSEMSTDSHEVHIDEALSFGESFDDNDDDWRRARHDLPLRSSQDACDNIKRRQEGPLLPVPKRKKNEISSSQNTSHSNSNSSGGRLNFPVVKDPYNNPTTLRFSPKSNSTWPNSSPRIPSSQLHSSYARVTETAATICKSFNMSNRRVFCFRQPCPTSSEISLTIGNDGRPSVIYQKPYYGNEEDVTQRQSEYAGREIQLQSNSVRYLPEFDKHAKSRAMFVDEKCSTVRRGERKSSHCRVWEFVAVPPSRSEVVEWFEKVHNNPTTVERHAKVLSQIDGPTQISGDLGFERSNQYDYMSIMSLEVHVNTRGSLAPNPDEDEVTCVFWCLRSTSSAAAHVGMISHGARRANAKSLRSGKVDVEHEPTELDLMTRIVDLVRFHDPDILTGYEVHNSSWGYLIERARKIYDYDLCDELSRVKSQAHGRYYSGKGFNHSSSIHITGRHMINIWRAMRSELNNLLQYTLENVVFHVLKLRIPHYSFQDLTAWHQSAKPQKMHEYFLSHVQLDLDILDATDLIPRTSEQARLLGVDFFSVLSRGSQFKVESLMFRIAKPENFLLVSPSKKQVGGQNALECLPLVMEPQSDFYTSPVVVLDFQSLYPSLMIAYNYCYSTFFGRVSDWRGRDKMGFTDYKRQPHLLRMLHDRINIAPNGIMYVKPEVRKSLLARMLSEILETRVMVKAGMKADKDDKVLQRLLNNKQLALKFIANVTYGYTSASFSGRMPCSEVADSIVLSGRETLEKAIDLIHSVDRWCGAEVVYGDTDSLFVHLKGRSRQEAFTIGEEIARAVTDTNPRPVKLKFEKVYNPCVLLAKKRYVGFKYEHRSQEEPEFDAKGIETVRRDGTPAEQKIEEKALKILFSTADLSRVKHYFQTQCSKIMQGRVSIQDFCFAKEVRLGTYSGAQPPPPGALISSRKMAKDPRSEPQYGERVPYVVITGAPGSRLIDRCVAPETLLHDAQVDLDAEYYITKNIIPPLERIFNLVGANVRLWYDEMPKFHGIRRGVVHGGGGGGGGKTLESYMKSSSCIVCKSKQRLENGLFCKDCLLSYPHVSLLRLGARLHQAEKRVVQLNKFCRSCMGVPFGDLVRCDSMDCPVFYSRTRDAARLDHAKAVLGPAIDLLQDRCEEVLEW